MALYITLVMVLVCFELEPPTKWWHPFSYIVTWPTIIGRYLNKLLSEENK